TVVPAAVVEDVHHVIAGLGGAVVVARQDFVAGRDHHAVRGGENVNQFFRAADVESVVVIDQPFVERVFAAVDVTRLVGHVSTASEPTLPRRVAKSARVHQRRAGGPEPHPGVLVQAPGVLVAHVFGGVLAVATGDRAINLNPGHRYGQPVVG